MNRKKIFQTKKKPSVGFVMKKLCMKHRLITGSG
jgi:hypothetical protein